MPRLAHILAAAAVVAGILLATPGASAVEYACGMSGEVSKSCCCASKSDDGCISIERACSCCEITYTDAAPGTSQPVTPAPAAKVSVHFISLDHAGTATLMPSFSLSGPRPVPRLPGTQPALYIVNSSFLR